MRRILSIALALLMVLSVAAVGAFTVSAETGSDVSADAVAINDASDFALMDKNGNYYLAADITVDSTYSGAFAGTLDGNGHTVTTSVMLFDNLTGATIKNLIIAGSVNVSSDATVSYAAALVQTAGDVVIENVVNNANVTASSSAFAAGLVGFVRAATTIRVENCVNNGVISAKVVGGLVADSDADMTEIVNCLNTADLTSSNDGTVGGIAAEITNAESVFSFRDCVNTGNLNGRRPGGILGVSEAIRTGEFLNCVNTGDVLSPTNYCGGITCRVDGFSPTVYKNCINTGNVTAFQSQVGGIVGYSGEASNTTGSHTFYGCVNTGTITCVDYETTDKKVVAGGLSGTIEGVGSFYYCVNLGDVKATSAVGGLSGKVGVTGTNNNGREIHTYVGNYVGGSVTTRALDTGNTNVAGGLTGYGWGRVFAHNNVVATDIVASFTSATQVAGGVVGYSNNANGEFSNFYFLGKITAGAGQATAVIGSYGSDITGDLGVYITNINSVNEYSIFFATKPQHVGTPNKINAMTDAEIVALLNNLLGYEAYTILTADDGNAYGLTGILPLSTANLGAAEATEAVAVTNEAEFLAMSETGNYYLANDITLTKTYAKPFSGKLDGKGKTVTVSAPMFAVITNAEISDLVIEGTVEKLSDDIIGTFAPVEGVTAVRGTWSLYDVAGALASAAASSTITGVTNNASVTAYVAAGGVVGNMYGGTVSDCVNNGTVKSNSAIGGIVGANYDVDATFTNCVNNGSIEKYNYTVNGAAGIIGFIEFANVELNGCVNKATINLPVYCSRTAGVVGLVLNSNRLLGPKTSGDGSGDTARAICVGTLTLKGCVNIGNITGYDQVGGLVAWCEGLIEMDGCVNNGNVTSVQNYAGGLVGRAGANVGQASGTVHIFTNCVNNGDITAHRQYVGGILGYTQENVTFKYCTNTGKVSSENPEFVGKCSDYKCHDSSSLHLMHAGGMIGCANYDVKASYCVNTGDIAGSYRVGGIAGTAGANGAKGQTGIFEFVGCYVTGNIYNSALYSPTAKNAYANAVGGIAGAIFFGSTVSKPLTVKYCGVSATIKADNTTDVVRSISGLIGFCETTAGTYTGNYFAGELIDVDGDAGKGVLSGFTFLQFSSVDGSYFKGSYTINTVDGLAHTTDGMLELTDANSVDSFAVASGELCYLLNTAAGSTVYSQLIGADEAPIPVQLVDTVYAVLYDADSDTYANPVIEESSEDSSSEDSSSEDTTETSEVPTTETTETSEVPTTETTETSEVPTTETTETSEVPTTESTEESSSDPDVSSSDAESSSEVDTSDTTEPGGCSSVIGASVALLALALVAPAAIVLKKDEE